MERTVALKKVGQLLAGKEVAYRINRDAPDAEERAAAKAALPDAIKEMDSLKGQREARMNALLEGDAEYQRLKVEEKKAREVAGKLTTISMRYRIVVGTIVAGVMFSVAAEGDSWEDVIAKLTKKREAVS